MFLTQTLGYLRNQEVKREGANLLERKEACNSAANFAAVRNGGGGGISFVNQHVGSISSTAQMHLKIKHGHEESGLDTANDN